MTDDPVMNGFLFLKGLTTKYGVEGAADLLKLADRLVARGLMPDRRTAVEAIETAMPGGIRD